MPVRCSELPLEAIREVCRRYPIRELSLFGSAAAGDLRPDSDVDLLVDFDPAARIGFLALAEIREAFEDVLLRHVDLVPKRGLKPLIRESVLQSAQILYAA